MIMALVTTIVIIALAALLRWGRSRNNKLGAIAIVATALFWAIYRAIWLQDVNWLFIRPLAGGWITLFIVAAIGVVGLVAFRFVKLATFISWTALLSAVLLPINDIFTSEFWLEWIYGPIDEKAIILGLVLIFFLFMKWFGKLIAWIAGGLIVLMVGTWALVPLSGGNPMPMSSASVSSSPSPSPSATTLSPSPTNSQSATADPSGVLVTDSKIVNWQQLKAAASAEFEGTVDASKKEAIKDRPQSALAKANTWDSPADDARLVVVFASKADISDQQARKLAGVSSKALITRSSSGCYIQYEGQEVCPTGNDRVLLALAPTLRDSKGLGLVTGWGVVIKSDDGKHNLWPFTYK